MNKTNETNDGDLKSNEKAGGSRLGGDKKRRRRFTRWWMPVLAAIGLVVAVVTGIKSSIHLRHAEQMPSVSAYGSESLAGSKTPDTMPAGMDRESEAERIRKARNAAISSFRKAIEAEHEAFKRRVSERVKAFDTVRALVPGTVEKYGFKKCWSVMFALAKDKVAEKLGKGSTTNFDRLMNEDLREGFYQPLQDARVEVLGLLNEFQVRLKACCDELGQNMARIPDWDRSLGEPPASLKANSLRIEEMMTALRGEQIGATVSATVEAVCLAGVCRTMTRLLAGTAGRLAAGMTAGAVTSQLDSPAPGPADLLALGICAISVAATTYDVHKAAKVIPKLLNKVMNETVDTQCEEVRRRTLDEGEKLYLPYVRMTDFASAREG